MEFESKKRIESLIAAANAKTGIEAADLTEAVQELCNGYGSGGGDVLKALIDKSITEISDESVTYIAGYAFYECTSLVSVDLPSVTEIGQVAFSTCFSLISVNLPSVVHLDTSVFVGCTALPSIDLPKVSVIPPGAFYGCMKLSALILRKNSVCGLIMTDAFEMTPIADGTGYIYVPASLLNSYKGATNWSVYANQFRALEDYTVDGTITGALDESKIRRAA